MGFTVRGGALTGSSGDGPRVGRHRQLAADEVFEVCADERPAVAAGRCDVGGVVGGESVLGDYGHGLTDELWIDAHDVLAAAIEDRAAYAPGEVVPSLAGADDVG